MKTIYGKFHLEQLVLFESNQNSQQLFLRVVFLVWMMFPYKSKIL